MMNSSDAVDPLVASAWIVVAWLSGFLVGMTVF